MIAWLPLTQLFQWSLIWISGTGSIIFPMRFTGLSKLLKLAVEIDKPNLSTYEIATLVSAQIPAFKGSETPQH